MTGGVAAGDYDGDGWTDLFTTRWDAPSLLWRHQGDGTFADVTAAVGLGTDAFANGAAWGDIDGDGDLDLFVTVLGAPRHLLYVSDGAGHFVEDAVARGADMPGERRWGESATFGDYGRDGWLDLAVSGDFGTSRLFWNRGDGTFDDGTLAAGVGSDEHGMGQRAFADVTVRSGGGATTQVREVLAGNAFLGQSEPVADFGFGASADPVEVVVRWPTSGLSTSYASVPVGGELVATEP